MLKNKLILASLLLVTICPARLFGGSFTASSGACAVMCTQLETPPGGYSAQELHRILNEVQDVWTQYTYGQLRSAYNHGTLTIVDYSHPNLNPAYNWVMVKYGGLEICVILDIA